ncbi:MAG: glycosyltransferase [Sediminibacterium sp.]|nr:glycosyltransferase [Sediminibacterium sp.]TXT31007.1 MAG: group 1 glycosyl transferase [Chitinophagaceae bacterium]
MNKQELILIGTTWPFRGGGIASFNERLARSFQEQGYTVTIYTFSLQYPSFLFPGKSQYSDTAAPTDLTIHVSINSVNPFNWIKMGRIIRDKKASIVLVRYWIPFMGACLGTILKIVKKNKVSRIICIADNIIPHEHRIGDTALTQYFVKPIDAFITLSKKVAEDLKQFSNKKSITVEHPLYDHFGEIMSKQEARDRLGIAIEEKTILFFGFIRNYKGLDLLLQALAILKYEQQYHPEISVPKLIIAGEYYEDPNFYKKLIQSLGIEELIYSFTHFIQDEEVKYYLNACDFVIQPYRNATQSGVTPLAYHFEKPMLVTNVGALPDRVLADKSGVVTEATAESIALGIRKLYELGEDHFLMNLRNQKQKYTWEQLTTAIISLANYKNTSS